MLAIETDHIAHFIHVHKFSFGPCFRLHLGIRVLNDCFEHIALNGPDFNQGFEYIDEELSLEACADAMYDLVRTDGQAWFEHQRIEFLLSDQSWLKDDVQKLLKHAVDGHANNESIRHSRSLLGL